MPDRFQPRDVEIPFSELGLKPGDQVYLEALDHSHRYLVHLVGYVEGESIIVLPPEHKGKQVLLKQDRVYTVRLAAGTRVCAFQSWIRQVTMQPYPLVHLHYPQELMTLQVRETERFLVHIPALISPMGEEGGQAVEITDLSSAGAGVESDTEVAPVGTVLQLRFKLSVAETTKALNLRARIRNRTPVKTPDGHPRLLFGLQFEDVSSNARIVLNSFIYEQSKGS
ncbi:flagellar brake protein [Marinobacteraceae bacterium S3BR75-40.1]